MSGRHPKSILKEQLAKVRCHLEEADHPADSEIDTSEMPEVTAEMFMRGRWEGPLVRPVAGMERDTTGHGVAGAEAVSGETAETGG